MHTSLIAELNKEHSKQDNVTVTKDIYTNICVHMYIEYKYESIDKPSQFWLTDF